MKKYEEVIKDIAIILTTLPDYEKGSHDYLRKLAAIEGMLVVIGQLHINKPLDYLKNETYTECILRHTHSVLS
jgi:hypothetical protein